jgi:drug/metabolite transporter (DMT)-like permease
LLQGVEVSFISITLFVQPLAGAILGGLLLGEELHFYKFLGGGVILLSMLVSVSSHRSIQNK